MRMATPSRLFVLILCLFSLAVAQSTTSSSIATTATARTTSSTTANGTTTLSANGTITATIANGTVTLSSTPTSSASYPSLTGVSSCVVGCMTFSVGQANCSSITDEKCYCPSQTFRNSTVQCVSTQCPSELANAESLAQQFCNMVSVTLTFPSSTVSGTASVPASVTASVSGTTRPNGARAIVHPPIFAGAALSGVMVLITMLVFE
ncbi:hypothetical protein JB92DRAFT_2918741 [Gautieria morchelliformis]|nr:hypothetical protein JB92DRAFT_2918741 [Gautieria morchelliformis]